MSFLLTAAAICAIAQPGGPTISNTTTESFESGFGGWAIDHYLGPPATTPLVFSVTRSQAQARTGVWSLDFTAEGYHDDGTVWIERAIDLPAGRHDIDLTYWLWSESAGQVGLWEAVAFIGTSNPETEEDFTNVGEAGTTQGWAPYSLSRTLELSAPGRVWVAVGYNIVFGVVKTHYFDDVSISVKPGCTANCDGSSTPPILNVNDFLCFQTQFTAGNPNANCDGSSTPPVLNIADFICFINRFAAGCG